MLDAFGEGLCVSGQFVCDASSCRCEQVWSVDGQPPDQHGTMFGNSRSERGLMGRNPSVGGLLVIDDD